MSPRRNFGLWRIERVIHAFRARRYYKKQGYAGNALPCLHCTWGHDPQDHETPWFWIYCDRCDWGNH